MTEEKLFFGEPPFRIEVGKKYLDNLGNIVTIVNKIQHPYDPEKFIYNGTREGKMSVSFSEGGMCIHVYPSVRERLIKEYKECEDESQ